ncbi:MAG: glycogen/starch/alpha-glucan family phosphorylase [Chlamydiota bacterium]
MEVDLEAKAEMMAKKIKHYLITSIGVTLNDASPEEFYRAFALTLREELMINWTATMKTYRNQRTRMVYYLCMEYMPGRFMGNNISNIRALKLVKTVMKKMKRSFKEELFFESDPGLGNGGLGRLASCLLDSLATQQYPAIAYGLRYQYGIFDQEIWEGVQVERPDPWLLHENPWEFRKDVYAASVCYSGREIPLRNKRGEEVYDLADYEEVRALPYDIPIIGYKESGDFNVNTLRLWTTKESPRNFQLQRFNAGQLGQAGENTCLTDVLYPNDNNEVGKRIRLKQEFLLASASIQDIITNYMRHHPDMSFFADKVRIQINDTHPALVIPELMRTLIKENDLVWGEAWEIVRTCFGYTNHTILRESLEEWNQNRLKTLLPRQYRIIERLNMDFCDSIRKRYPGDEGRVQRMSFIEDGQVKMAHLAIYGSQKVNGVAFLHSEILKNILFKDFNEMYPDRFINVTNGVTQRKWLLYCNPLLSNFITKKIGNGWITDFKQLENLAQFADDEETLKEFLLIKKENKKKLIKFLQEQNPVRDFQGRVQYFTEPLSENALYDVQVKRMHEYKRQLMNVLHALMIYYELQENFDCRLVQRQIIFAGKAAPGYEMAKNVIALIYCVARKINKDARVNSKLRILFIENYNVSKAEIIMPAADLSEQISTAGMEASGTGNMKLAMNGALTMGTEDGANIEMHESVTDAWWPFSFGCSAKEVQLLQQNRLYNPWEIYSKEPRIARVIDVLRDGSLAETESEHQALVSIASTLLESDSGCGADRYFVLQDLLHYYEVQKKAEDLFIQPMVWAKYCIHNIAAMGPFSTDESIHNYAKLVWGLTPCPVNEEYLSRVRSEYQEHDKCRIL